jgi:hypothetical protein
MRRRDSRQHLIVRKSTCVADEYHSVAGSDRRQWVRGGNLDTGSRRESVERPLRKVRLPVAGITGKYDGFLVSQRGGDYVR